MSAESLYEALHSAVAEQLELDDPVTPFELIGVIEQLKADLILSLQADDDDDTDAE